MRSHLALINGSERPSRVTVEIAFPLLAAAGVWDFITKLRVWSHHK